MNLVALTGALGRLEEDGSTSELELPHPSVAALLWEHGCRTGPEVAATCAVRRRFGPGEAPEASMLAAGASVWGVGMNYRSKQLATGRDAPDEPVMFVKAASSFRGFGSPIAIPGAAPDCVDYEGEIAVMIGAYLHCAGQPESAAAIAGYLAANDVTARDVMRRSGSPSIAKSFPGFGQLGSTIACVGDSSDLDVGRGVAIRTYVDGELRQEDSSNGTIIPIAELVSRLSAYVLLRPGDLVLTGTPAGTGDETGRYLSAGDTVEVRVGALPPLVSNVVGPPAKLAGIAAGATA